MESYGFIDPIMSVESISRGCYRVHGHYIIYTELRNGSECIIDDRWMDHMDPDQVWLLKSLVMDFIRSSRAVHLLLLESLGNYCIEG